MENQEFEGSEPGKDTNLFKVLKEIGYKGVEGFTDSRRSVKHHLNSFLNNFTQVLTKSARVESEEFNQTNKGV